MFSKILIVGNSPATTVCSIYLHTANKKHLVIKSDCNLNYKITAVAGIENPQNFTKDCFEQIKNMEITVIDKKITKITHDLFFTVELEGEEKIECEYLVVDKNIFGLSESLKKLIVIRNFYSKSNKEAEGIVVSGAGCKAAFALKEILQ
ncbi:hypothetical protein NUSPORA_00859 [Nucleospora cyclopteri]